MAIGDILDWGFLYKEGSTWNAAKAATPSVSKISPGRIGIWKDDATHYGLGRFYVAVDTNFDDEELLEENYISCRFSLQTLTACTVSSSFIMLTQYWYPSLDSGDWSPQNSRGYSSLYDSTPVGSFTGVSAGFKTVTAGNIAGNYYHVQTKVANKRYDGEPIFNDNKTYYTLWRRYETTITPTSPSSHSVYIAAPPSFSYDTNWYGNIPESMWFIKSGLTGSAEIGPNKEGGFKTNNKYGTR